MSPITLMPSSVIISEKRNMDWFFFLVVSPQGVRRRWARGAMRNGYWDAGERCRRRVQMEMQYCYVEITYRLLNYIRPLTFTFSRSRSNKLWKNDFFIFIFFFLYSCNDILACILTSIASFLHRYNRGYTDERQTVINNMISHITIYFVFQVIFFFPFYYEMFVVLTRS